MNKVELDSDGQLKNLQDFLASADYSRKVQLAIQQETKATTQENSARSVALMSGLQEINRFWEQRVVYGFREGENYDAVVVNVPIIEKDWGATIDIRYIVATRIGLGYIRYRFSRAYADGESNNLVLHTALSKLKFQIRAESLDSDKIKAIESLYILNTYFEEYKSQQSWSDEFGPKLFLSSNENDHPKGQLLLQGKTSGDAIVKFTFPDIDNDRQIKTDLENIFAQLDQNQQEKIDAENTRLRNAKAKLATTNQTLEMLSSTFQITPEKKPNRNWLDKLKRKRK